ncbi:MAG: hypothetical protein ACLPZF_08205, partial [Candidatus Acidiferrales bacterium]
MIATLAESMRTLRARPGFGARNGAKLLRPGGNATDLLFMCPSDQQRGIATPLFLHCRLVYGAADPPFSSANPAPQKIQPADQEFSSTPIPCSISPIMPLTIRT